jgi:hypothetical protein
MKRISVVFNRNQRFFHSSGADPAKQVEGRPGFVIGSRSSGTAEGLLTYDCTCGFVVEIEISSSML